MTEPRDPYADLAEARDALKSTLMVRLDRYLGPLVGWLARQVERRG